MITRTEDKSMASDIIRKENNENWHKTKETVGLWRGNFFFIVWTGKLLPSLPERTRETRDNVPVDGRRRRWRLVAPVFPDAEWFGDFAAGAVLDDVTATPWWDDAAPAWFAVGAARACGRPEVSDDDAEEDDGWERCVESEFGEFAVVGDEFVAAAAAVEAAAAAVAGARANGWLVEVAAAAVVAVVVAAAVVVVAVGGRCGVVAEPGWLWVGPVE